MELMDLKPRGKRTKKIMITFKKSFCKSAVLKIIGAHLLAFFSFIIMSTLKNLSRISWKNQVFL